VDILEHDELRLHCCRFRHEVCGSFGDASMTCCVVHRVEDYGQFRTLLEIQQIGDGRFVLGRDQAGFDSATQCRQANRFGLMRRQAEQHRDDGGQRFLAFPYTEVEDSTELTRKALTHGPAAQLFDQPGFPDTRLATDDDNSACAGFPDTAEHAVELPQFALAPYEGQAVDGGLPQRAHSIDAMRRLEALRLRALGLGAPKYWSSVIWVVAEKPTSPPEWNTGTTNATSGWCDAP